MNIVTYFFICLLSVVLCKDNKKYPPPIDFEKGLDIKNIIPKNLNHKTARPITDQEIEKIKNKAANYVPDPVSENDIIIFETSIGNFKGRFFNDKAPNHCYNFKKLANSGFYDNTKFHRVIPNFMVQAGDILSRDGIKSNDGTGSPGWTVDAEFNDIKHVRGTLSMARSPKGPNTAGSQFFICVSKQSHLDGQYTAFGEITEKLVVIDHIVNTPTDSKYAIDLSVSSIPEGEDKNNWIMLKNPKTGSPIYYKVPKNKRKDLYKREMIANLRSNNPVVPVVIYKIRVVDKESVAN